MHNKGSQHVAAQTKLKEKELWRQQELNKRIALSSESKNPSKNSSLNNQVKPSVEQTRTAILELQSSKFTSNAKDTASNDSNSSISIHERRKRELKFIAAGWKRDCHGKWYRDENVSFLTIIFVLFWSLSRTSEKTIRLQYVIGPISVLNWNNIFTFFKQLIVGLHCNIGTKLA